MPEMQVVFDEPECTFSVDNECMEQTTVARIEFKDTHAVIELRDAALAFFKQRCEDLGAVVAALCVRLPDNMESLGSMGGLSVVTQGSRELTLEECTSVISAAEKRLDTDDITEILKALT